MSDVVFFPDHPAQVDMGFRARQLTAPYVYEWEGGEGLDQPLRRRIIAPEGFIHDGASVPRLARSVVPPHPLNRAGCIHDLLYRRRGVLPPEEHQAQHPETGEWVPLEVYLSRRECDQLFRRQLGEDPEGPGKVKRGLAYAAVRVGGRGSWDSPGSWREDHPYFVDQIGEDEA